MYLHLGQGVMIPHDEIIGVFDLDNTTQSYITRDFLSRAEKSGGVINIAEDIPKSFVVCVDGDVMTVYLSQLNPSTLLKRSETDMFVGL